jgi:hypothetical protein
MEVGAGIRFHPLDGTQLSICRAIVALISRVTVVTVPLAFARIIDAAPGALSHAFTSALLNIIFIA